MKKKPVPMLLLRCGCAIRFLDGDLPICATHGNQPVARVINMPAPTFRGMAVGPHCRTEDMAASYGRFAGSEKGKES